MNASQTVALANHCRFGFEMGRRIFAHLIEDGRYSLVLSVNSGYE